MPEKKSDTKYRRSPSDRAENFSSNHRKYMAEVFGEDWKNDDKLNQYVFGTAYGQLTGELAELKANIDEGAPALVYMNDGRVLKGEATYYGGVAINVTHREFPLLQRSRVVTETVNLADTAMLYVKGGKDYVPSHEPGTISRATLNEEPLMNLCMNFTDVAMAEKGEVVEYNSDEHPSEIKDLWGEKVLVVDYSGKILQGEGYYESKTRNTDPDGPDYDNYPAILVHTGEGNKFEEVPLYRPALVYMQSGVDYVAGCKLDEVSHNEAVDAIRERILQYRPRYKEDGIPEAVFEARMENVVFAESEAEKFCKEDSDFRAAFFGYKDRDESDERAAAGMMLKIAAKTEDTATCEHIFRASAWADGVSDKSIKRMAEEAVDLVCDTREKLIDYRNSGTQEKPTYGKER